jgi:hypothetical protein
MTVVMSAVTGHVIANVRRSQRMRNEFRRMSDKATAGLEGDCPLCEDAAILWASGRISKLEDLVAMIIDSESADSSIIPYLHQVWLSKAKELKEEV